MALFCRFCCKSQNPRSLHNNAQRCTIDPRPGPLPDGAEVAPAPVSNGAFFSCNRAPSLFVVRSPWTAADALVGLSRLSKALVLRTKERVQGTRAHQGGACATN